ncbi:hypothetical protein N0O92_05745 [Alkalihalobacillus sp. MEB130]|uniref:hypothetical protein n=1 Tax=Alkalihalobacillus sp. MEB130 TaxID=2976704 RepID=UPI0028DDCCFA|nr:hypothetical protein [Alkalihalobacillus sp. MEB130]MDT8859730.1 hypothetical protein [Alkalihalobacillus sp. MEB130]
MNIIAVVSGVIFGNIITVTIYTIIQSNEVFMTTVHGIFLNPLFLVTGGYLGVFVLYRLILISIAERM